MGELERMGGCLLGNNQEEGVVEKAGGVLRNLNDDYNWGRGGDNRLLYILIRPDQTEDSRNEERVSLRRQLQIT